MRVAVAALEALDKTRSRIEPIPDRMPDSFRFSASRSRTRRTGVNVGVDAAHVICAVSVAGCRPDAQRIIARNTSARLAVFVSLSTSACTDVRAAHLR